jgi:prepilin-type N-terminal cleavage/methylation domain-containing protein
MKRGYSLIELVLVMFLLVLVAFYVFSVTGIGSQAYLRLTERQNLTADLRIGLSYLDVKIKTNDRSGAVSIRPDPFTGQTALLIGHEIDGQPYQTWIYLYDGALYELFVSERATVNPAMGNRIVAMDALQLDQPAGNLIRVTLVRGTGQEARTRTRTIGLRSDGGAE